jgi:membrane-associated phospholipid phosphatase
MLRSRNGLPTTETNPVEEADIAVTERLARYRNDPGVRAAGALSELADQPPLLSLCGAVLAWGLVRGDSRIASAGGRMLASVLVATALKTGLKRLVARTRPHMLLDEGRYEVEAFGPDDGDWHSFPSGHTAGAVAAARALGREFPAARWPAYAAAAGVAAIQVPRAKHYPVDVVAGALVGLAAEAAVDQVFAAFGRAPPRVDSPPGRLYPRSG